MVGAGVREFLEPGRYLAFLSRVDGPGEGASPRRRAEFLFDAISLRAVTVAAPPANELPLFRVKTTLNHVLGQPGTETRIGEWFLIDVVRRHGGSWVWAGTEDANARSGFSLAGNFSATQIAYLGPGGDATLADDPDIKKALAVVRKRYTFKAASQQPIFRRLRDRFSKARHLYVEAIDVGQASFITIHDGRKSLLYFDAGLPLWFNEKSLPDQPPQYLPPHKYAVVILSHWDYDHYSAVQKYSNLRGLRCLAPAGGMGPNAGKFAKSLGKRLTMLDYGNKVTIGPVKLRWGVGLDKNNRGILALVEVERRKILLAGDASYESIEPRYRAGLTGVSIPHHASKTMYLPANVPSGNPPGRAIVCAGQPNKYGHPVGQVIAGHSSSSWSVHVTGKYGTLQRGNKRF